MGVRRILAIGTICGALLGVCGQGALAQVPPPPAGAGKGHWEVKSDTTSVTFDADAVQPGTRNADLVGGAGKSAGGGGAFSGDAGKGAASAARSSTGQAMRMSGAATAKSSGGSRFSSPGLLEYAAGSPDLWDKEGQKAWKLGRSGADLTFAPYDADGALHADKAVVVAGGKAHGAGPGGTIALGGYAAGKLTGSFHNKLTKRQTAELAGR
ncbi:MAG: hypothetical protein FJZ01_02985 [Candidatus Sericytochromatia bacterium]|nr:hypothetical protein [Candidatus Tanganyikabacteria bacterium]